jgi:hypothetical protein
MAPDRNNPTVMRQYWTPCSPGDPDGKPMTWQDIQGDELLEPVVTMVSFLYLIKNTTSPFFHSFLSHSFICSHFALPAYITSFVDTFSLIFFGH